MGGFLGSSLLLWIPCRLPGGELCQAERQVTREAGEKPKGSFLVPSSSLELKRHSWPNSGANPGRGNLGTCMALLASNIPLRCSSAEIFSLNFVSIHTYFTPDLQHTSPVSPCTECSGSSPLWPYFPDSHDSQFGKLQLSFQSWRGTDKVNGQTDGQAAPGSEFQTHPCLAHLFLKLSPPDSGALIGLDTLFPS